MKLILLLAIVFAGLCIAVKMSGAGRREPDFDPDSGGPATLEEVTRLAKGRQLIPAIKMYRRLHPEAGLKEAKDAVEKLSAS